MPIVRGFFADNSAGLCIDAGEFLFRRFRSSVRECECLRNGVTAVRGAGSSHEQVPWSSWVCLGCNSGLGNSINQSRRRRFKSSHFPNRHVAGRGSSIPSPLAQSALVDSDGLESRSYRVCRVIRVALTLWLCFADFGKI